jgi:peptidoglycan/LPS O-acetylase OafA/YrhL
MLAPAAAWYVTASGTAAHPLLLPLIITAGVAAVAIPLAWLSYNIIERPMMRLGSRL